MKFGFLESWWSYLSKSVCDNFWSLLIVIAVLICVYVLLFKFKKVNIFSYVQISFPKELSVGGFPITVNRKNKKLAYMIWVELKTRKIALDFDEENDVIVEIYDSWYEAFKLIREYIKDLGEKSINDNLRNLSLGIINDTMRPHLTKYQSRFRRWFDKNYDGSGSVQDVQKKFPNYNELVSDLKIINRKCQDYLEMLEKIYN